MNGDVLSYEKLGSQEGKGSRNENCMQVDHTSQLWMDKPCSDSNSFLCSSKGIINCLSLLSCKLIRYVSPYSFVCN